MIVRFVSDIPAGIRVIILHFFYPYRDLQAFQNIEQEIAVPAGFLQRFCEAIRLFNVATISATSATNIDPILQICSTVCFGRELVTCFVYSFVMFSALPISFGLRTSTMQ
jgi:hypothetical protein